MIKEYISDFVHGIFALQYDFGSAKFLEHPCVHLSVQFDTIPDF